MGDKQKSTFTSAKMLFEALGFTITIIGTLFVVSAVGFAIMYYIGVWVGVFPK